MIVVHPFDDVAHHHRDVFARGLAIWFVLRIAVVNRPALEALSMVVAVTMERCERVRERLANVARDMAVLAGLECQGCTSRCS